MDVSPVLNDLDPSELLELERYLWIYGGDYWRPVVDLIHGRLTRPARSFTSSVSGNLFKRAKAAWRVEELAAKFTELVSSGSGRLKGLCPLHDEQTGSFYIYLDAQRWYRYGACSTGGDVIELGRKLLEAEKW